MVEAASKQQDILDIAIGFPPEKLPIMYPRERRERA